MHFSSRVDTSSFNPIALAERQCHEQGVQLTKLNDANPTRHGFGVSWLPEYAANPRGSRAMREQLAAFLANSASGDVDTAGDTGNANDASNTGDADHARNDAPNPEHLFITSSTSQGYSWLMKLLCDEGDAVLAPTPGYPLIASIARLECCEALPYQLRYDGSWYIDMASVERQLAEHPRVRAIVVIHPNNPTGSYVKAQERKALLDLCQRYDVALIADEVFFPFSVDPLEVPHRFAGERSVLTFALDGFSKMLAAPGAKVGWIAVSGSDEVVEQALRRLDAIADDFLPMSDIIAAHMGELLEQVPSNIAQLRARVRRNAASLQALCASLGDGLSSMLRMEGGWNALLRLPSVLDENELVLTLIERCRMTGQPGYFFDMTSNGYMAISLLPEPAAFDEHVATLLALVAQLVREV